MPYQLHKLSMGNIALYYFLALLVGSMFADQLPKCMSFASGEVLQELPAGLQEELLMKCMFYQGFDHGDKEALYDMKSC